MPQTVADKGYDAESLRQYCDRYRMQPVIPYRAMRRKPKPGLPRLLVKPEYRERNVIERLFCWLKEHRRLRDPLLQTHNKLCRDGYTGLLPAVFTTPHFVQGLGRTLHQRCTGYTREKSITRGLRALANE